VDQAFADEQVTSPQAPGKVVWTLTDNLGTVRDLAVYNAQTGQTSVVNHRVYDSFGNLVSQTNAAVDCLFGFAGMVYDEASGTYVTPTRRYKPTDGRWDGPDWILFGGGDTNLDRYCGNSPTNATDPSGTWRWFGWLRPAPPPETPSTPLPPQPPHPGGAAGAAADAVEKERIRIAKEREAEAKRKAKQVAVGAAAGLGIGAILYWTISELSRLFPPRNLVPVP
jgi:RHS repeat-associated protein